MNNETIERIRGHMERAEFHAQRLASETAEDREVAWKLAIESLLMARVLADTGNARSETAAFIRRLVIERCDQLTRELHEVSL